MNLHVRTALALTVLATAVQLAPSVTRTAAGAGPPSLTVAGGARMYPAYDPATSRYAVHPAADGTVRVDVTGADQVWFDGVPDADGSATLAGRTAGDEISVILTSGSQRRALALHVLPTGFPTLAAESTGAPLTPGNIALTLDQFDNGSAPRFEAVVDRQGVPVWTRSHRDRVLDLKAAANGHLTVHRPTTTPGRTGGALVELDERFEEVRRIETTGLVNTDDHDSLLLPDGSRWLLAYEPNPTTGLIDSVIQHVSPSGEVLWQWTSAPHADETVVPGDVDYAHINAIDVQPNGDVLASFRNFSSVFLIRPGATDEVVWKLGGRDSDFTFPDLPGGVPDVGPCAQHSATILPNGNVLVFDNGSSTFFGRPLCVDQQDLERGSVQRPTTRVVEFELSGGVASPVRTYGETSRFAWFMGSAARTSIGNVLIGWSSAPDTITTETDAGGATVWSLADTRYTAGGARPNPYITYRSALVPVSDGFDPEVVLDGPADGLSVTQGADVPVSFSCTDRGGSTLQSCDGPAGRRLDTATTGTHTWSVTAADGAGRSTTRTRTYTVVAAAPVTPPTSAPGPVGAVPDLSLRLPGSAWIGAGATRPDAQDVRTRARRGQTARAIVRLRNSGDDRGRFVLRGPALLARGDLSVTYTQRGVTRTRAIGGRGWRTPALAPGKALTLRVVVRVRPSASAGLRSVRLDATSADGRDRVRLRVRVPAGM